MAHGFLSYTPVSGDNFWKNLKDVYKGLRDLAKLYDTGNKILKANVRELDPKQLAAGKPAALPSGAPKALAAAPATKMLGAGSGSIVGKNPTNIDVKTGERPESGPRLPGGVGGGPSKGGGFTDIPGIASAGLNTQNFFSKAVNEGIDVNTGQYLSKEARIAAFKAGKVDRNTSQGPSISPDSGVDIVAAVNRNTQMIVSLVDAVKTQTQNDSKLTEQQIQTQETLMLRSAAAQKEAALEQGGDYSGFMTPENFEKKKKEEKKKEDKDKGSKLKEFFRGPNPFKQPEGCGCSPFMPGPGGGGGILGGPPPGGGGLPIPDFVEQKRDMMRRPSRLGGGASAMRRGGGKKAITRAATKIGGKGLGKAVGKGLAKKIPGVGVLAGGAFAAERAMKGDWLGAGGELLSGIASIVPGLGTAVSAGIDAGLAARDAGLTPFAAGGIITQPTAGLVGEAGNEGIFPLEGSRGRKTFKLFGEGIFEAQKDNDTDFAKLQSMGLKQYYENERGAEKLGKTLALSWKGLDWFKDLFGGGGGGGDGNGGGGEGNPDFSGSDGQAQAMNYFMSQGLSKEQAAGIVGNLMQESGAGLDPNAKNATGHRGIAQWDANRWGNFEKWAKKKGIDVNTREAQLQWIMEEMRTGDGGLGIERFKTTKTAEEAAALFVKDYERSGEKPGQAGYDKRISNAKALAAKTDFGSTAGRSGGGSAASLAATATRLKGLSTNVKETDYGKNGCVYAVNKVFQAAGITPPWGSALYVPTAEEKMIKAGWQKVPYNQAAPGDVMVMKDRKSPPATHIGIMQSNGKVLSNSSGKAKMTWEDTIAGYNSYYGGQGVLYRMPGTSVAAARNPPPSNTPPAVASKRQGQGSRRSTTTSPGSLQASVPQSTPGPVPASPAAPNTGTPIMATSAQVAMASAAPPGAAPTIINNYYGGGGQSGGVNPNGVSPGIGMDGTGTSVFQELKIRALA
jgi:hypothetical protein